jgi:hypothetical protein
MKMIVLVVLLFSAHLANSQTNRETMPSCPSHVDVEITRQAAKTVYHSQQKSTPGYPLDTIGILTNRCPETNSMYIIANSDVPFDDILTALNGAAKNQIGKVSVFIKKGGFFIPLSVGDQSSKDPTK